MTMDLNHVIQHEQNQQQLLQILLDQEHRQRQQAQPSSSTTAVQQEQQRDIYQQLQQIQQPGTMTKQVHPHQHQHHQHHYSHHHHHHHHHQSQHHVQQQQQQQTLYHHHHDGYSPSTTSPLSTQSMNQYYNNNNNNNNINMPTYPVVSVHSPPSPNSPANQPYFNQYLYQQQQQPQQQPKATIISMTPSPTMSTTSSTTTTTTPSPTTASMNRMMTASPMSPTPKSPTLPSPTPHHQLQQQRQSQQQLPQQQSMYANPMDWQFSDFQLLKTVGTGTFGKVKLAKHVPTNQFYAIKIMRKCEIIQQNQVNHVHNEKQVLSMLRHPFIVRLYRTFQDEFNIYMIMEYVSGGELFSHLRKVETFPNDVAKFYSAEIILALEHMHKFQVVYRDLKPENILLDGDGNVKITDFGFAKQLVDGKMGRTFTGCGTNEYLAPEVILQKGHGMAVDWWTLGVLIFEMLVGYPPFYSENLMHLYQKILQREIEFPQQMDWRAKDLIRKLLKPELERIGNLHGGVNDIKNHPWFDGVDWDALNCKLFRAPIQPRANTEGDTSYFTSYNETPDHGTPIDPKNQILFLDF